MSNMLRSIKRNVARNQSKSNYFASHGTMLGYKGHMRKLREKDHEKSPDVTQSKFQRFKAKAQSVFTNKANLRKFQDRGKS